MARTFEHRGADGSALVVGRDAENRSGGQVQKLVRRGPEHRAAQWALAVGTDHDHLGVVLLGCLEQGLSRAGLEQLDDRTNAGC